MNAPKGNPPLAASAGSARNYETPEQRADRYVNAIVADSVDQYYTSADNALFMLDVTGRVCAAFIELKRRCEILQTIVAESEGRR